MIAVGLWGAQLRAPAIWALPVAFPMMMALGGLLGLLGAPLPGVEIGIAASALVLGVLILLEARLPLAAALLIVAAFAIFHGYAHGAELAPGTSAVAYSLAFVIATGMLHAVGILTGPAHRLPGGRLALRGAGLPLPAHAHLVTTGVGPFYDGAAHFFLSFEELLPVLALALLAGLRGAPHSR